MCKYSCLCYNVVITIKIYGDKMAKLKKQNQHRVVDSYSKYKLNELVGLDAKNLVLEVKKLIDEVRSESRVHFYPEVGTAFCDVSTSSKQLLVVEPQEDLSVFSNSSEGYVSCRCPVFGSRDFPSWLNSVKSGSIEIVWCPVIGRVHDNEQYLSHWNLL